MRKGNMVTNRLNDKSGPKSEALISFAVLELQKGHAFAAAEIMKQKIRNSIFISYAKIITYVFNE